MEVDGVVGCGHHGCLSVMHLLCMSVLIYCYEYIEMVAVFMHKVIVCGWYGHTLITI